ncbi:MAG: isoleucine--tRNA ligase [Marmoricola sp.]
MTYRPVPPQVDLPALERQILDLWTEKRTFQRSVDQTAEGQPWTFYEGPPTANGMPGAHHVEARVFKDVFPRFHTMRGRHVIRKAGWDCHGLPVELAVEKELGFSGKPDIEAYGIAAFNERCRESVERHTDAFEAMTRRMGYWVDMTDPYRTMDPSYVESVWWALKQIYAAGRLVEDYRVAPYCPRCGTGLSDHELAQGYETVTDPSVYVTFPLTSGPLAGRASLLIWTTTPWTLVSNALVAANPELTYVAMTDGKQTLVVAEVLAEKALGEGWTPTGDRFTGSDLEGWTYERPFTWLEWPDALNGTHFVVTEAYVTAEDGTGLVHQAPAFGEDDFLSGRRHGVGMVNPIDSTGHFDTSLPLVGGQFFRDANAALIEDLTARGLLFRKLDYEHSYPHCWRCHTALLYYAQPSWYIRTTAIKDELIAQNEKTTWFPDTIKHGRYGDWLENNIDWALSRSRYWGTPLPIWRCAEGHQTCVESLAELGELTGTDQSSLDPHRPFVDDVFFDCPVCGGTATRVPEVIDAWFDSGSMPFAQWGYPHVPGSVEMFERRYPADFIAEAIDQTRGWFYTLMAVGTLVFEESSYKNVLCLGHILAEDGRKMSKHLGNILEPLSLMDEHGADAVRWFMACAGSPWSARRVGHTTLQETVRKVLLTYWNTVAFQALYANLSDFDPSAPAGPVAERHVLDRWVLSEANHLIVEVTEALEGFDTQRAGTLLATYVDDLSNWYVRRSRRRFWDGSTEAFATLHEALRIVTLLMAPLTPFITEQVWQDLFADAAGEPDSVHLAAWPAAERDLIDADLGRRVKSVRRLVELGRAARAESKIRTRQPLGRALVPTVAFASLGAELLSEIAEELNVELIEPLSAAGSDLVSFSAKGNFRALGKRFGQDTPRVAQAIAAAEAGALAASLTASGTAVVDVDGRDVAVLADEVILSERPHEGWSVVNEQGETIALDLEITPELRRAGLAREMIRSIQETRKSTGFDVSDRIALTYAVSGDAAEAFAEHRDLIAREVLASTIAEAESKTGLTVVDDETGFAYSVFKI